MKHKLLGLLAGTALFSGLGAVVSQPSNAAPPDADITFVCNEATRTTHAQNTQTGEYGPAIIDWNSRAFEASGYTPLKRCREVSWRFARMYSAGRLNFFTAGVHPNGYQVICAVTAVGETCNGNPGPDNNILLTVTPGREDLVAEYLQNLGRFQRGDANARTIEESGGRTYVSIAGIIASMGGTTANTPSESPSVAPETTTPTGGGGFGWGN